MPWLLELIHGESVATAVLMLGLVAASGLALGSVRVFGISLGIAGVLFSGLLFGHFKFTVNKEVLEFAREFGLILFVYTIGVQVGPGILSSLRREGLPMNLLAAGSVLAGVLVTVLIVFVGKVDVPVAVGMFSGATTNTPSLAAAQSALRQVDGYTEEMSKLPGLGYAVAYPFGIIGIILTMLLTRIVFRINPKREGEVLKQQMEREIVPLTRANFEIANTNLDGILIKDLPGLKNSGIVVSRVMHQNQVAVAQADTRLALGDVLLAVGTKDALDTFRLIVGKETPVDLVRIASKITTKRLIVTKKSVIGKTLEELAIGERFEVRITRLMRASFELTASPGVKLQFGDTVLAVGDPDDIEEVAKELGNSLKRLNHPEIVPIFVGIALGVIVGSYPISVPGIPSAVKLGLAGGPLLVAIVLSRIGRIGPLVWYMPESAIFLMREIGIALFLACVGLKSGDRFVETLVQGSGLYWMALAVLITIVPLLLTALVARMFMKVNYLSICGLLAGSMTDPPALAFACTANDSEAPMVAYATVYPLTMILRVISAQIMVLLLMR
ncbi:MAG: putative transporter [Candidatus Hydrogenedentes bacterium]|nr:putative transporter [Candidatus Hydrogenedentota bacterium]